MVVVLVVVVPCFDEEEGGRSGRWREVRWWWWWVLTTLWFGSVGSMLKGVLPAPSRSWRALVVMVVVLPALVVVRGEVSPWPSSSPSEDEEGVPDILAASSTMIASASVLRVRWDLRVGLALAVAGLLLSSS